MHDRKVLPCAIKGWQREALNVHQGYSYSGTDAEKSCIGNRMNQRTIAITLSEVTKPWVH